MGKKINDIAEFPAVTPADDDRLLGVDVSDTSNDPNGEVKTFRVSDLRNEDAYATAEQGGKADTAVQPAAIADFETTTQLNARDTANRSRANHTGTQAQSTVSDLTTDLAAKAPLASPAFTGSPTAPTQAASDNSTKLATTAYVDAAAGGGGGGGLVPISKTTASNDAAVDISLTGGYSAYLIRVIGAVAASSTRQFHIRTSSDGGTSFDSGGSDYGWTYSALSPSAATNNDSADSEIQVGFGNVGSGANDCCNIDVIICPAVSGRRTIMQFNLSAHAGGVMEWVSGAGARFDNTTVDAVRFLLNSGNIASGDFHLYGIADGA